MAHTVEAGSPRSTSGYHNPYIGMKLFESSLPSRTYIKDNSFSRPWHEQTSGCALVQAPHEHKIILINGGYGLCIRLPELGWRNVPEALSSW